MSLLNSCTIVQSMCADMLVYMCAALPSTYTDVQDIDDPFSTQIQMASAYAQPNAEFMRELEVRLSSNFSLAAVDC